MQFDATITSRSNARVKALRASFSGEASAAGEVIGVEGEHLISEALRSGLTLQNVYLREGSGSILERNSLSGVRRESVVVLSREVFASAVETAAPQGIAATLAIPGLRANLQAAGPLLVLEALRDPGNMGTLLRSAEAFGVPFVIATADCANVWSPKVVRASAGSVFRLPVLSVALVDLQVFIHDLKRRLVAAVVAGEDVQSSVDFEFGDDAAILIGNEGAGLSATALTMADHLVRIPCAVESLNAAVAGSTLLYEAMRQREALHKIEAGR